MILEKSHNRLTLGLVPKKGWNSSHFYVDSSIGRLEDLVFNSTWRDQIRCEDELFAFQIVRSRAASAAKWYKRSLCNANLASQSAEILRFELYRTFYMTLIMDTIRI